MTDPKVVKNGTLTPVTNFNVVKGGALTQVTRVDVVKDGSLVTVWEDKVVDLSGIPYSLRTSLANSNYVRYNLLNNRQHQGVTNGATWGISPNWLLDNKTPSNYQAQLTLVSGVDFTAGARGWVNCGTTRIWEFKTLGLGKFLLEIRDSSSLRIVGTRQFQMEVYDPT